ncbi:hypothetical protein FWD07_02470 [Candidatus Saccharibacteria bacterium]|nr:hypothetical protein [Candidatus Saccharibacteria bacterium]
MKWMKKFLDFVAQDDESDDNLYYEDYAKDFFPVKKITERDLINLESKVGATIFGAVPKGRRREFFNLDPDTWIWHEEWTDENGDMQQCTVRYEVSDKGVLKVLPGLKYSMLKGAELENFRAATMEYVKQVSKQVYRR